MTETFALSLDVLSDPKRVQNVPDLPNVSVLVIEFKLDSLSLAELLVNKGSFFTSW